MRLTTKGRFAVTAMIDLAMREAGGPVTLADISGRQKISLSYLSSYSAACVGVGWSPAYEDRVVGYRLAQPAQEISVADIIVAVDEVMDATQCGGKENCRDDQKCITHDLWQSLNERIFDYLRSVTLAHMVAKQQNGGPEVKVLELKDQRGARRERPESVPV